MKKNFEIASHKAVLPGTFSLTFRKVDAVTQQLRTSQRIPLPREEVFAFFKDPRNLSEITPDWLQFRMRDFDTGEKVSEGAEYDYSIKWLPCLWRTRWRSRIVRYIPPERFTDIQIIGPYTSWEHLHTFEDVPEGTKMNDVVTYRLPFGLIGNCAHRLLIQGQLEDIFSYRAMRIHEWASGNFRRKARERSKKGQANI